MIEWWQALLLALIQGLTEFLPISSSAHLILPSQVLGWPDQGLLYDVAVHVGTLFAVLWYFRGKLFDLAQGSAQALIQRQSNAQLQMVVLLAVGTVPAALAGLLFNQWIEQNLRSTDIIIVSTAVFAVLLWIADRFGKNQLMQITMFAALVIGLFQVLALIPGTSRSGITITAALLLGYQRKAAAEFSFLLSIPLIAAAGLLKIKEYYDMPLESVGAGESMMILLATVMAFISALLVIRFFLAWIDRVGMTPFVIYRLLLAALLAMMVW